ncbi:putative LRR receptor-like serine/threonine-protein kinase [Carex littledalei]|uniref:Putative LRR receptor-like serine/threonine-protein kinase n=1 Tax=Carex littledalei TaxID=544730 RepID=A0A833VEY2_9POAL|nr:putative LRR receptor-like serine/threonine-protein kinase [Carex littledalei]
MAASLSLGLVLCLTILWFSGCGAQSPGFLSIDCGGNDRYTDELGLNWEPDTQFPFGRSANISVPTEARKQYTTLRYFPADNNKYCYPLNVTTRTRYLLRATFLYGNFDNSNVFPKFDLSIGPSRWSSVVIYDMSTVVIKEVVFLASSSVVSVCVSNATTGQPFISTLELRRFNGSLYYTDFETRAFMSLSARINFGALSNDPVRYPDDPYDRIWQSDTIKKANYLVDVAPGTTNISTAEPIDISSGAEKPPQKVMQTAVVGMNDTLSYRLNLPGFPGFGWAFSYFSEIEELGPSDTRKFKLVIPGVPDVSKPTVNVLENAAGMYRVYEPGYYNISLPFTFSFKFRKTNDSTKGPILNAIEIYKYLPINLGSPDAPLIDSFASHYSYADWAQEGGDPCLPTPRSWIRCTDDSQPSISSMYSDELLVKSVLSDDITKVPPPLPQKSRTLSFDEFSSMTAHRYSFWELEQATSNFEKNIGSGGFGVVYYGKTKDEKEIAVKVLTNESAHGRKQFSNEVSLLSRIHHRNLVSFLGYCPQEGKNMLVYELMHNGTLKEHLHGLAAEKNPLSWIRRLEIAEDSARGYCQLINASFGSLLSI